MLPAGKLFAIAAILALLVGVLRLPAWEKAGYAFTIGRSAAAGHDLRVAAPAEEYWAFCVGAIFAVFAAIYYWFPLLFSRTINTQVSQLHFWMSTLAAFAFLFAPALQVMFKSWSERAVSTVILAIAALSCLLFLIAQVIFVAGISWSAAYGKK